MKIFCTRFAPLALVGLFLIFNQIINARNTAPLLKGINAVKLSNRNDVYDSLFEAVKDARREGECLVAPTATRIQGAAFDCFGSSVGISGEIIVVGAIFDDFGTNFDQGSAYVFERTGTTWTQKTRLIDTAGASNDEFGSSAAIPGDKIAVGSPNNDNPPFDGFGDHPNGRLNSPEASEQGAVLFYFNTPFAPTAAGVSISGRVVTPQTFGLTNGSVTLTDAEGTTRTVRTGKFGAYRFRNVEAGATYILTVTSNRYTFAPQIVTANEDVTYVNFTANW